MIKTIIKLLYENSFWMFVVFSIVLAVIVIYLKRKKYKSYSRIWRLFFLMAFTLWFSNGILKFYFPPQETPVNSGETTGAINIVEQFAWDYTISIGENIEEAINSGVRGKDFISIEPIQQPNINKETQDENNKLIRTYLSKYKSEFIIPETKTNGYLIFVTSTGIADNRGLFFGVRGKSEGETKKSEFIDIGKSNWYVYDMKNIWVGNYKNGLNLFDLSRNGKTQVGGVVSEDGNKVERIIMVFY